MLGSSSATSTMSTGAQAYHGCNMATQLKKTFRVFKSYSRKSVCCSRGLRLEFCENHSYSN